MFLNFLIDFLIVCFIIGCISIGARILLFIFSLIFRIWWLFMSLIIFMTFLLVILLII